MILHSLLALGLHFVPLFLLIGVKHGTNLRIAGFMDVHHFGTAILLGLGRILVQALHLGALGLKDVLHFGLLIRSKFESLSQFGHTARGIGWSVMAAAAILRRRGWLIVG
jgi:hypothetical protein